MNDLSDSFVKAKLLDDIQAEILKKETSMGINIVNYMKQEMLWGSCKEDIVAEVKRDYKISDADIKLYYQQAVDKINSGTWI
jgi:ribosome-interacting GTPase 1